MLLSAAHMPGEAWVGLNDINIENQFVYTDGTPAVSDEARNDFSWLNTKKLNPYSFCCTAEKSQKVP